MRPLELHVDLMEKAMHFLAFELDAATRCRNWVFTFGREISTFINGGRVWKDVSH